MFSTDTAIRERIEYSRTEDGGWQADFHGFADISARGKTLESCRFSILQAIDAKLAEFVAGPPAAARSSSSRGDNE